VQQPSQRPGSVRESPFPPGWLRLGLVLGVCFCLRALFGPGGLDLTSLARVEAQLVSQGQTLCRLAFGHWPWGEPRGWLWLAAALLAVISGAHWLGARRTFWLTALALFPGRSWLARLATHSGLALIWPLTLGVSALFLAERQRRGAWLLEGVGAWCCLLALSLAESYGLGASIAAAAPVALMLAYRGRQGLASGGR
jgi:hypothetical protein